MRMLCGTILAAAMLAAHGEVGAEAVAHDAKPLKVLSIGNSFSIGMHAALPPVAKSFGRRVDICTMFIGGCSLERHCKNLAEPESAPYKINWTWDNQLSNPVVPFAGVLANVVDAKTGKVRKMSNIPQMLRAEKWDVVTIQQASHESWKSESYHPFGDELVKAIREGAPQAKIVVQETWSYVSFCPRYAQWGIDQTEMYNRLHKCYGDFAAKYGFDVIPVGTAVQLYRRRLPVRSTDTEVGGDPVGKSPNGDSIHMNANGEYLQSLVWAGALLGVDVAECNYVPKAVSREKAAVMRECAARAVAGAKCKSGAGAAARPVPCQVSVSVGEREFKTYPFSDPDPVPATSERRYPYFRYDGSTDVPEQRVWKTVTLESDRLAVTILPEVGGKVWGAYDKVAKRDFLYANHVMKFRDIAMRGPWVSGGIEFNFGVIGHSPCTSTPVDWHVRTNGDGSASCFVGGMEYITRSFWQVEVVLKGGADEFETRTVWYNASGTPAPYYHWMNAAYSLRDDPEFLFDGKSAVGHGGEILTRTWPIDAKGRDVSLYRNNCYGGPKSLHFVGGDSGFYGIWWRDLGYGSMHRSLPYEKYGRKLFIWALSREGGIWEDLLTDGDGQYAELQSGRCFNQPRRGNVYSPFKHPTFVPGTTETFTDRWGPLRSREEAKSDAAPAKPRPIDPAPGIDWSSPRRLAVLGIQALRTRDDCKGEDMLKSALAKDGTIVEAMLGLAELAYRRGQYASVHELAEKAMSFDLYDHAANYLDGAAYFAEGDMPSARERLGVAAFSGGWRAAAMAMIARSFLREGDMHAALTAAEESLRSEGLQMDALLVKAIALRGAPVREAFLANVLKRLPLAHQFRYELEGVDALRRAVGCELPHETFLEIGSWYEETGLVEDARRIFRLALPNPVAEMRLAFIERRPPVLAMKVEGAFPFRRESRPALEAAAATGGWKAKYFLAVLKGFFRETEESSALLESCGDEPDESVFYLYRARTREGKRRMDDLLRARETGDSWRVGRDIMEAHEKSGDMAQMLSTAEEYLRRFPSKNPLQIGYARALMKLGRHAECMEYLKGVKILPSEHRDSATGIWHECQKALGLQPTWPENLGQGEPYHDGEWRQTE